MNKATSNETIQPKLTVNASHARLCDHARTHARIRMLTDTSYRLPKDDIQCRDAISNAWGAYMHVCVRRYLVSNEGLGRRRNPALRYGLLPLLRAWSSAHTGSSCIRSLTTLTRDTRRAVQGVQQGGVRAGVGGPLHGYDGSGNEGRQWGSWKGFLPDRLIGANVMFLRQLPHLMYGAAGPVMVTGVSGYWEVVRTTPTIDGSFSLRCKRWGGRAPD
jgi:hypothetical protein